ncbi:MAG: hypothetical protein OZ921_05810 [Sorangiineae bacterium]|nr:hypothetical protein [Polyangiaceae bacterium]MEB2322010.1 hypothetical protein [Sorangiineae bacterium]
MTFAFNIWARVVALLPPAMLVAGAAQAAGYDQPLPFAARHVGIGGTSLAEVDSALAPALNPGGLGWIRAPELLGGVTLMTGVVRSSPEPNVNVESERVLAPVPLFGAAMPIASRVALGLAARPLAAAGAAYEYRGAVGVTDDEARAAFVEVALGVGVELPGGVALGVAQRTTYATMSRFKRGAGASGPGIDSSQSGLDFTGVRVGAQWHALSDAPGATGSTRRRLRLGAVYRHQTTIDLHGEEGVLLGAPARDLETRLLLPSRFGGGLRADFGRFGGALEAELVKNGDNGRGAVSATRAGERIELPAIYDWRDAVMLRAGAEVRVLRDGALALRAGAVYDGPSSSRRYPSPFAPPPAPTYAATVGAGFERGAWSVNVAYALRFGSTTISGSELGSEACALCGYAGEYGATLHLISADLSHRFD